MTSARRTTGEALKKQGLKLAILSNGEPMLEAAAKSAGIRDLLDEVISVEEVKIFKTSNRVYWLATERLRVSNPELGFVSANTTGTGSPRSRRGCELSGYSEAPPKFRKSWASRLTPLSRRSRICQPSCVANGSSGKKLAITGPAAKNSFPVRRCPTAPGCRSRVRTH